MEPISLILGGLSALSGGMSAIGGYQQGRRQTEETNRARQNQYRDQLRLQKFKEIREGALYRQEVADYKANILEAEQALNKGFTRIGKRAAERYGRAAFADVDREAKLIQAEGQIAASMPAGASRDRAIAMLRGAKGRDEALMMDNLLRARFADIDTARDLTDQANSYRRRLFQSLSPAPMRGPTPTAPVMQSGPSALSLIGGLGSAAVAGLSAGLSASSDVSQIKANNAAGGYKFPSDLKFDPTSFGGSSLAGSNVFSSQPSFDFNKLLKVKY